MVTAMMGMEWMMGPWWMGGGMWLGWLLAVGVLAVLRLGAVAVIRWLARDAAPSARAGGFDPALAVLRERHARVEIGREEFQRMRQDLS